MTKIEIKLDPSLNNLKLPIQTYRKMRHDGLIRNGSPYWWDTDYSPDPRDYMLFDEFQQRLVSIEDTIFSIYPDENIPMTTITLPIDGVDHSFMVTARPYHPRSRNLVAPDAGRRFYSMFPQPIVERIDEKTKMVIIEDHYLPHVHGLFAGVRQNHYFWYPIAKADFIAKIDQALVENGFPFIKPHINNEYWIEGRLAKYNEKTYWRVRSELARKSLITARKPIFPDFTYEWISSEELLDDNGNIQSENKMLHYPLRLPGLDETIPLVMANRTHKKSLITAPAVLGVAAGMLRSQHRRNDGFWRIKNRDFAEEISDSLTTEFGLLVEAVLFQPHSKPQYKRV